MTRKLSISMPDTVADYMYGRLRTGGYGTISEYVRELVRLDQRFELLRGSGPKNENPLFRPDRWSRQETDRFR